MNDFIGKGWSFPIKFNSDNGNVSMASGKEDIEESLAIIMSTAIGERLMMPDFGTDIHQLMFENLTTTLKTHTANRLRITLSQYEPRIKLEDIQLHETLERASMLEIHITYTIKMTNSRHNLVFPYYYKEGTHVKLGKE
ncbi:MAG: GPW/gp25 family protein [Bacteroidia bacterium]|nr:GPW/gp25 family protein [Bacteroidia bacterium]